MLYSQTVEAIRVNGQNCRDLIKFVGAKHGRDELPFLFQAEDADGHIKQFTAKWGNWIVRTMSGRFAVVPDDDTFWLDFGRYNPPKEPKPQIRTMR